MLLALARPRMTPVLVDEADIVVASGGNLQTALNNAVPGNIIEVEANATFTGNFTLPAKTNPSSLYITVRSSAWSSMPAGRLDPVASAALLPKIKVSSGDEGVLGADGCSYWRFLGIEFAPTDGVFMNTLLSLGADETVEANLPSFIEFDRCYFRGDPLVGARRGGTFNANSLRIERCYFKDFKGVSMDTQAIWMNNCFGPFVIEDNYLEAAGENIMFGGQDPTIAGAEAVPADGVIERNHFTKPDGWNPHHPNFGATDNDALTTAGPNTLSSTGTAVTSTAHGITLDHEQHVKLTSGAQAGEIRKISALNGANAFVLTSAFSADQSSVTWKKLRVWTVKNLFEIKNGLRIEVVGNIFENHWAQSQSGTAIVFVTIHQNGSAPYTEVGYINFHHNIVRQVPSAISLGGQGDPVFGVTGNHMTVSHNLLSDLNYVYGGPGATGWGVYLSTGVEDTLVEHNTIEVLPLRNGRSVELDGTGLIVVRPTIRNNIFKRGLYGVRSSSGEGTAALNADCEDWIFENNLMADDSATTTGYPATTLAAADFETLFQDYPDDWELADGSPYIDAGTDGQDLGVDWAALQAALE